MNGKGEYKLCPIFDNGASLLADTKLDYPIDMDIYTLMDEVQAKTVSMDFDKQLDVAEELYGRQITFYFTQKDVDEILRKAAGYSEKEIARVRSILYQQMRKYSYLFKKANSFGSKYKNQYKNFVR